MGTPWSWACTFMQSIAWAVHVHSSPLHGDHRCCLSVAVAGAGRVVAVGALSLEVGKGEGGVGLSVDEVSACPSDAWSPSLPCFGEGESASPTPRGRVKCCSSADEWGELAVAGPVDLSACHQSAPASFGAHDSQPARNLTATVARCKHPQRVGMGRSGTLTPRPPLAPGVRRACGRRRMTSGTALWDAGSTAGTS